VARATKNNKKRSAVEILLPLTPNHHSLQFASHERALKLRAKKLASPKSTPTDFPSTGPMDALTKPKKVENWTCSSCVPSHHAHQRDGCAIIRQCTTQDCRRSMVMRSLTSQQRRTPSHSGEALGLDGARLGRLGDMFI
jgi:hypothetical protein